ncbi:GAF and ANTAR domain-containing protein [Nesterenkonia sp. LB17]|uniref:GAF and ANTAR domain-containing protein n=1 Tax=unclassified Nesterenkonia TaxID=2629769 RepID=UPI001F4C7D1C|nr:MULTISPECIES: GAF and ANTAR domain-containing protein [unclassified Nesterenkonia]MCH8564017.1 GAF and ANTAR domain-containing protein [Nesterenkonia sp. YGD6]MCH8564128.1 GAF and ANTAR domain-containing protein [Nesterenkonia sp. LB17]
MQSVEEIRTQANTEQGQPSAHDQGSSAGAHQLASQLGDLARSLNQESPEAVLELVVAAAIELIPGVEEASLSIVTGRKEVETVAPSSELLRRLDDLQVELTEGPCLEAIYSERTIRVRDMATETRWPSFAEKATEAGVGSMLAFQLFVVGDNLGALNLYSSQVDAFDDDSEHVGLIVASHAAVALADAQQVSQLHEAVQSRDVIGQAKGILMERYKITGHQAFLLLAKASQHTNKKLQVLAEDLVNSGELTGGKT